MSPYEHPSRPRGPNDPGPGRRPPRIAFVGSGGAARGIAHLGVLKACEELGIKFDVFVGASAGAIVGATYGQGIPVDVLIDAYRLPWRRKYDGVLRLDMGSFFGAPRARDLLRPGYLTSGLFDIGKLDRVLRKHLPQNDFRRIDKTILITAVDVDGRGRVVFGKGYNDSTLVSEAVAASCCVPGLFRPFEINGRFHLDGELVRTLSADLAVEAGVDIVIVSNIYRQETVRDGRRSIALRGPMGVLTQSLNIVLSEKERRGLDLYARTYPKVTFINVSPDIGNVGYLDRWAARTLVMRGYREALRELAAAKDRGVFEPRPELKLVSGG
ncbi:MAG: patatin-like phospholipase family protein [Deltaproteobacteria bacterium]|nr:patatin-like phospholipase family protein [Deltaproteobacteria bacterium]